MKEMTTFEWLEFVASALAAQRKELIKQIEKSETIPSDNLQWIDKEEVINLINNL